MSIIVFVAARLLAFETPLPASEHAPNQRRFSVLNHRQRHLTSTGLACLILLVFMMMAACERRPPTSGSDTLSAAQVDAILSDPVKAGVDVDARTYRQRIEQRGFDPVTVVRGRELFLARCASCHGFAAEGASNWQQRRPDGKEPPPPQESFDDALLG